MRLLKVTILSLIPKPLIHIIKRYKKFIYAQFTHILNVQVSDFMH